MTRSYRLIMRIQKNGSTKKLAKLDFSELAQRFIVNNNLIKMKIRLIMMGKTSENWLKEGIERYFGRMRRYLPFEVKVIPDIKNAGKMSSDAIKQQEGDAILKSVNNSDLLVLLDENGKMFSSKEFAGFIEKQMISGCRHLVFVIGGAWGVSGEVVHRTDQRVSLSPMTFSHQMVRLVFAEQLYRAMSIINNEPYHHD